MNPQKPCGKGPFGPLRALAKTPDGPAKDLSSDGPVAPVVDASTLLTEPLTAAERATLLELARTTLRTIVGGSGELPEVCDAAHGAKLAQKRACFVTLTKQGELRGCVGQVLARDPLYQAIVATTRSAAFSDPRFSPVTAEEVPQIRIEISILTEPQPLKFSSPEDLLNQLRPHEHGVVFRLSGRFSTFLPQVWEYLPDRTEFMDRLAEKAGFPPAAWRSKGVSISVYRVESFEEE